MSSVDIIDVNETDFEMQVLAYSQDVPVVVDFWAEWCTPCRVLGPILEKLASEAQGAFRLAKVNVDDNPNLALRYQVRSIPAVKAFREGKPVAEFIGAQPEPKVREFIRSISPSQSDLFVEKGASLLADSQPESAEIAYRKALEFNPDQPGALLGLARSLLMQGRVNESSSILENFPASREYTTSQSLLVLVEALNSMDAEDLNLSENPLDAAYNRALYLIKHGNLVAAMDGLLDILRQDRRYHDGVARKIYLAILDVLGNENPTTRQYRDELALTLF